MRQRTVRAAVFPVLILTSFATAGRAEDFLEVGFDRYEGSASTILYDAFLEANKDGATTCGLVTPLGTYTCMDLGGRFRPEPGFFEDHTDMTLAVWQAVIASDWTLTWDAGATQTVATIDFGTVSENDFAPIPLPVLTAPLDGVPIVIPGDPNPPTIEWNYGTTDPCVAQPGEVLVFLANNEMWWNADIVISSDGLACSATSWTPAAPLSEGSWLTVIQNGMDLTIPNGITVVEGTWVIGNPTGWFALGSRDKSRNDVVPTKSSSWGRIKVLYTDGDN